MICYKYTLYAFYVAKLQVSNGPELWLILCILLVFCCPFHNFLTYSALLFISELLCRLTKTSLLFLPSFSPFSTIQYFYSRTSFFVCFILFFLIRYFTNVLCFSTFSDLVSLKFFFPCSLIIFITLFFPLTVHDFFKASAFPLISIPLVTFIIAFPLYFRTASSLHVSSYYFLEAASILDSHIK